MKLLSAILFIFVIVYCSRSPELQIDNSAISFTNMPVEISKEKFTKMKADILLIKTEKAFNQNITIFASARIIKKEEKKIIADVTISDGAGNSEEFNFIIFYNEKTIFAGEQSIDTSNINDDGKYVGLVVVTDGEYNMREELEYKREFTVTHSLTANYIGFMTVDKLNSEMNKIFQE